MSACASWFADLESMSGMRRYPRWLMEMAGPHLGPRVVEIGCGIGSNMLLLGNREYVLGVDKDAEAVLKASERIAGIGGMEVKEMDVLDPGFAALSSLDISGVLFVNVLSLVGDSTLAVSNAARVLRPGGRMVIIEAAMPAISGRLDREWGLTRFRPGEMRGLLVSNGLEVETLRYFNLLGFFGWLWDSVLRGRDSISREEYMFRDRFVPLARFIDLVTGPPIGRSLFAVARKK